MGLKEFLKNKQMNVHSDYFLDLQKHFLVCFFAREARAGHRSALFLLDCTFMVHLCPSHLTRLPTEIIPPTLLEFPSQMNHRQEDKLSRAAAMRVHRGGVPGPEGRPGRPQEGVTARQSPLSPRHPHLDVEHPHNRRFPSEPMRYLLFHPAALVQAQPASLNSFLSPCLHPTIPTRLQTQNASPSSHSLAEICAFDSSFSGWNLNSWSWNPRPSEIKSWSCLCPGVSAS